MIPARLIRTVQQVPDEAQDALWAEACALHPTWEHTTYRDPVDRRMFPMTSALWDRCRNGAQLAGLIRLEALYHEGGIYLDSDVRLLQPLEPLLGCRAFAGYEDSWIVPDAVLGAEPQHPAIGRCIDLAKARLCGTSGEPLSWLTDQGAWSTGPGVTTTILKGRPDVLLLPPDSFYPVHHFPRETRAERMHEFAPPAWCFGVHAWSFSWG